MGHDLTPSAASLRSNVALFSPSECLISCEHRARFRRGSPFEDRPEGSGGKSPGGKTSPPLASVVDGNENEKDAGESVLLWAYYARAAAAAPGTTSISTYSLSPPGSNGIT